MQLISPDINLNFMGRRKLFLTLSAVLVIASLLVVMGRGINYGIDFAGGLLVQVKYEKSITADEIRAAMYSIGLDDAVVQSLGEEKEYEFLIRSLAHGLNLDKAGEQIKNALTKPDNVPDIRRVETVGPKAGKDLREKALLALFFSLLLMGVYISGRFEHKWILAAIMALVLGGAALAVRLILQSMNINNDLTMALMSLAVLVVTFMACVFLRLRYATGAVVSTAHDAIVTIGVYTMLGREFNLSTVAALLTIIGFSVNDTIIIYDRIRENLRKGLKLPFSDLINRSVNQTLSRTILTSGTLLIVVIILCLLGGGVIADFAVTMLIGVIVATYSSIYIASPILLMTPATRKQRLLAPAPKTGKGPAVELSADSEAAEADEGARPRKKKASVHKRARRR
jgi:preprotein translocase subunit SecF